MTLPPMIVELVVYSQYSSTCVCYQAWMVGRLDEIPFTLLRHDSFSWWSCPMSSSNLSSPPSLSCSPIFYKKRSSFIIPSSKFPSVILVFSLWYIHAFSLLSLYQNYDVLSVRESENPRRSVMLPYCHRQLSFVV